MTPRPRRGADRLHPDAQAGLDQARLELWGGYECTINRVGDTWMDQTPRSGHDRRLSDLDLFADLGLKSLRYPVLWERVSPASPDQFDFSWPDERLPRLRELGINPILTLCHHGSGPHYTNLMDDSFAPGLARHAATIAARFPWVRDWTPVNEQLTTARFSALYGYWYPHAKDETACWIALLNEVDATRLSMREIRKVNPDARLVQTDDLGFCHSTDVLRGEAEFQNHRRWLGWDLLCGMVKPGHALWDRLVSQGLEERLRVIAADPCPPDIIGVNHYLSSERFLDHRLELHGDRAVADRDVFVADGVPHVDVDAIRSLRGGVLGLPTLLRQAWERYGIPLAVTECHLGGGREQQTRWFVEVWNAVDALREEGMDIRAVTAWSLLGAFDWHRMVTRVDNHYEVGVFDLRHGDPRPTALAHVLKDLAAGRAPDPCWLHGPGWWRRDGRFGDACKAGEFDLGRTGAGCERRPLLIVGAEGMLGRLFVGACEGRGLPYRTVIEAELDGSTLASAWAVMDARDWAGVGEEPLIGRPGLGGFRPPEALVAACAAAGVPCVVFSADTGFEEVEERLVAKGGPRLLLARTDGLYGVGSSRRFAVRALAALRAGLTVQADSAGVWDEAFAPDVVDTVLDLLIDGHFGVHRLLPPEPWSAAEFVRRLAVTAECDEDLVIPRQFSAQSTEEAIAARGRLPRILPSGEAMVERFVAESRRAERAARAPSSARAIRIVRRERTPAPRELAL